MTVLRKGLDKTITLTLGELPNAKEARASVGDAENDADVGKLGLSLAPAAIAAVLLSTPPVFSLFIEAFVEKRPITLNGLAGTLLAVIGVAVLSTG